MGTRQLETPVRRERPADAGRHWADATTKELLDLATGECGEAWQELIRRYGGLVTRVARRTGLSAADAADASQLTWLRLFERAGSIRNPDALGWWLATTARRESIRLSMRTGRETLEAEVPSAATSPSAEAALLAGHLDEHLERALQLLEPHHRQLLLLLHSDERLSYAEVARRMHIPMGSIGPTRGRSLQLLRRGLSEQSDTA